MTESVPNKDIPLQNARHELYAQHRALGMPGLDACAASGFQRSSDLAIRLDERPEIMLRIQTLSELRNQQIADRRRQAEQHNEASELGVTSRWVLERLKENVDLAQDAGQFGAANSSLKLIADLIGMKAGDPGKPSDPQPALPGDRLDEFAKALNDLDLGDLDDGQFMLDELDASDDEALQQALSEIPEDDPEDIPFLNHGEDK